MTQLVIQYFALAAISFAIGLFVARVALAGCAVLVLCLCAVVAIQIWPILPASTSHALTAILGPLGWISVAMGSVLAFIVALVWRPKTVLDGPHAPIAETASTAQYVVIGAIIPVGGAFIGSELLRSISRPELVSIVFLAATALVVLATAMVIWLKSPQRLRSLLVGSAAALISMLCLSVFNYSAIKTSASQIAVGRPYCLQVADSEAGYREAESIFDLSPLTMRATSSNGRYLQRHALLIIENKQIPSAYYWSYRSQAFIPEFPQRLSALTNCQPVNNFVGSLDLMPDAAKGTARSGELADDTIVVRVAGKTLIVPKALRPQAISGPTSALSFIGRAPSFSDFGSSGEVAPGSDHVYIEFSKRSVESAVSSYDPAHTVREADDYGLIKLRITGPSTSDQRVRYVATKPDGNLDTVIDCFDLSDNSNAICQMTFLAEGWLYKFHHTAADVPHWREMQAALIAKIHAWEN